MKRFLLLAALDLTNAINAEMGKYYLLGMAARKPYVVPMQSLKAC